MSLLNLQDALSNGVNQVNKFSDKYVPKVADAASQAHQFLYNGNNQKGYNGSAPYRAIVDNGSKIVNGISEHFNGYKPSNPVEQLVHDYTSVDLGEKVGKPLLENAGFNQNAVAGLLFLPGLVGMVRGKREVSGLKKLTPNDLATGNYTDSVERAYAKGQRQYVKKGEVMDAGWKKADFGKDLYETAPFNPAKRRVRGAERRARQLQGTATQEMFIEAFGNKTGKERYSSYKKALDKIYKYTDPSKFDVDHISSLKYTPVHHPRNMRLQNSSRNRSEGARELSQHLKEMLLLANNIEDQIRLQGPATTPFLRQKLLSKTR